MIDKLQTIIERYDTLAELMSRPDAMHNMKAFTQLAREHSGLTELVELSKKYIDTYKQLQDDEEILNGDDPELKELVRDEIGHLREDIALQEERLKVLLIPKDPNDNKNTILEIRSGTGGDEAALFAGNLYRMYLRFTERQNWKSEIMTLHDNEGGGIKEVIVTIMGEGAYGLLKFESGVHRVQRIPETESSGRVHTSAATVAVLPEAEDVDIEVNEGDLKIDTYRASGAGGQHVNKTESAIRITHNPTGLVVTCQDETSQHKNRDKAMKVLRSRLYELEMERQHNERADARKSMVSTGDRSAKIRTYNFPQGRVTDHRINLTLYKLNDIMDGDLTETIEALQLEDQKAAMEAV
ncbi:MAG: peptide chain release factor 1 [Candidatus Marinimicrobia bacterium]|jgi:peptide chain release factor 1|nr:peptide chain release factor 1 [Candidatus Neomarinimicrobiota bacterium]MDP6260779.1 peptide chain release factor 1 [Candidatus Neomarinimicrobiota bacterium]MDP7336344.1 peptide chain release factor 1 [Candidatus Neomarinimicrobiota bacterium]MDP7475847.1 peptide chain release factor 1 [Candidatus Neomarinimicrobiota bacterium]|tara:strand:- start:131 stop:1192 length:1062 start_codon:yes stop_codon:yes gene_type:complete